jgi:hypothetical protein
MIGRDEIALNAVDCHLHKSIRESIIRRLADGDVVEFGFNVWAAEEVAPSRGPRK